MGTTLRLGASLLAIMALALVAVTAGAAENPHATYTCTKPKKNGKADVRVSVPDSAVQGLTNAGFTCVPDTPSGNEQGGDQGDEQGTEQNEDESSDESSLTEDDPSLEEKGDSPFVEGVEPPAESRSLFCSAKGAVERANGDAPGIALNLPESEGSQLVEQGIVTRAIFYEGTGVSCDVLPGFTYSGHWVDNAGQVVPGVAVYPYYVHVPTS